MTDIVERLQGPHYCDECVDAPDGTDGLHTEAAAEIEQLRAANIGLATESHELQQEVERLRAALEVISNGEGAGGLAETERLQEIARAALAPGDGRE